MASPLQLEIAIIGSGLSGLSLALHLSAQNIKSTIYEFRQASYSQSGEIALSPNTARILNHLGIHSHLAKQCFNSEMMTLLDRSGRELGVLKQGSMFGYPALRLKRTSIREALLARCESKGVRVVYEKKFFSPEEEDKKADVFFADGDVVSADLVVGTHGLRSGVRNSVDSKAKATFNRTMMIYANIPASTLDAKM